MRRLIPLLAVLACVLTGCGETNLSALKPQGPIAEEQFGLMKLAVYIMVGVVVVVFAISAYVLIRYRKRPGQDEIPEQVEGNHTLEVIWTVIPIVLLLILAVPTVSTTFKLAKDYSGDKNALQVKVTAKQFWWEFEYPGLGVVTAQDLWIPTDKTIQLTLTSSDVVHSFWVPALAGKMDTNPGMENKMYLKAPKEGVYKGKCAELCGASHALMDFKVVAVSPDKFDAWVAKMKAPVSVPAEAKTGEQLFKDNCLSCHAVGDQGTRVGPNLTDIANREKVAGFLDNTKENLKDWIADPQKIKPGTMMPKVELNENELNEIVNYLSNLK